MSEYFYVNIDKLISDKLLLSEKEQFVKVEELFNIKLMNIDISSANLDDNILLLYILCLHKMSTFNHDNIIRHKLMQFFNYHKGQIGGSHFILLNTIKQYITDKVSKIQPKSKIKHLE
jgi:hypothetical protein